MGVEESSVPVGSSARCAPAGAACGGELLIAVHGARRTGKTALIAKMRNDRFDFRYAPTPTMEAAEMLWTSSFVPVRTLRVTLWEVVDRAIGGGAAPLPDASSVDTYGRADGVIVLYDARSDASAAYAEGVIAAAPRDLPVLCLANFADALRGGRAAAADRIAQRFGGRINYALACIPENRGLSAVAEWLNQPLEYSRRRHYAALLRGAESGLRAFRAEMDRAIAGAVALDYGSDDEGGEEAEREGGDFSICDLQSEAVDAEFRIRLDYD